MSYNILLQKSNDKRLLNNNIFNTNIDINLLVFKRLKELAAEQSININTLDLLDPARADLLVFFDIPYRYKSDIKAWRVIFQNREKSILFLYEPPTVNPFNYMKPLHRYFRRIFTWNNDLVDEVRYFKFYIQQSRFGLKTERKHFQEKKLLVIINANKSPFYLFGILSTFGQELYSERRKVIEYFEKNSPEMLDLYGRGWNKPQKYSIKDKLLGFKKYKTYKGEVRDKNKIELLSNYKYCLCFENFTHSKGFLTEKVFDCLKAKCVPIYWGADDIESYIPKDCYVDYRDFMDPAELLEYLDKIDEDKYNQYVSRIEQLLKNRTFLNKWFEDAWAKRFLEIARPFIKENSLYTKCKTKI